MLKYVSKFILDILPSLVATVIGAYIVNHYIIPKTATTAPLAAAASTVLPKADARPSETPAEVVVPEATARGKMAIEKAAVEKPAPEKNASEKAADKPAETTASIPAETRRRPTLSREKSAAKTNPAPTPVASAPSAISPSDSSSTAEERRDANDLARAAIERLRASNEVASHPARAPDQVRAASPSAVQSLPPAIVVSTPRVEPFNSATASQKPAEPSNARSDDSHRPPADIPASRPVDLHAEAAAPPERTTVADEMLSAAKSVFQVMLPR